MVRHVRGLLAQTQAQDTDDWGRGVLERSGKAMTARRPPRLSLASLIAVVAVLAAPFETHTTNAADGGSRDPILDWNQIALQAVVNDHSGTFGPPTQGGPTRGARALAIVHIAMYDAVNAIDGGHTPYITVNAPAQGASIDAAVARAAHDTLVALYPEQGPELGRTLAQALRRGPRGSARSVGLAVGAEAAANILSARVDDGSDAVVEYTPGTNPGDHQEDPLNPGQGFLTPGWGGVTTFSGIDVSASAVRVPPPPALTSSEYAAAFDDVKMLGGDGVVTPTLRTDEQTEIGIFWAYDGTKGIGVPPVLYNQAVRVLARQQKNTVAQNARLFALANIAMADAGIACWDAKYFYNLWRPVVGIREAGTDDNEDTSAVGDWTPLGAPASNESGRNFTPPFPAYTSGHATFGGAMFRTLAHFYGTDAIAFRLRSDEMSGRMTDSEGTHRRTILRSFRSFSDAAAENARSRIYLGIHWQFDADAGVELGNTIGDYVFAQLLR